MKKKIVGILVMMLLIITSLQIEAIRTEINVDEGKSDFIESNSIISDDNELFIDSFNPSEISSIVDEEKPVFIEYNSIVSDNPENSIDSSNPNQFSSIVFHNLEVEIDSSSPSEIGLNDYVYEIYEMFHLVVRITVKWDPEQPEKKICLRLNGTLPAGATCTCSGCVCDDGEVTCILDWLISEGQAETYNIDFIVGETCEDIIGDLKLTIIVRPNSYTINAGEQWEQSITFRLGDKLICLWADPNTLPEGATLTDCHCDYGVTSTFKWTPSTDQEGEHEIIFLIGDDCIEYDSSFSIKVTVYSSEDEPPEIQIEYPLDESIFTDPYINLSGIIQDDKGIVEVSYLQEWSGGAVGESWSVDYLLEYPFELNFSLYHEDNVFTIEAIDENGNVGSASVKTTLTYDTEPPEVEIIQPQPGFLYIYDKEIMPFPLIPGKSVIIGPITIKASITDDSPFHTTEFYVDNELKFTDGESPFEWIWDETVFLDHTIATKVFDDNFNCVMEENEVLIFNIDAGDLDPQPTAEIEPDAGQEGVTGNHVDSRLGVKGKKHYVSPKESGDHVVLRAATRNLPAGTKFEDIFEWDGGEPVPGSPDKRRVPRFAPSKTSVKIRRKSTGAVEDEMIVWIVWATISRTRVSIGDSHGRVTPRGTRIPETATIFKCSWKFVATIQPPEIITDNDIPDLKGTPTHPVPGSTKEHFGTGRELSGGVDRQWDISRQARVKIFSPTVATAHFPDFEGPALDGLPAAMTNPANYPTPPDDVEGNDDSGHGDEDNRPYHIPSRGKLISKDTVELPLIDTAGGPGDTFEMRCHFQEFVRVQLGAKWYRISDFSDGQWKYVLKAQKIGGRWRDNGSVSGPDNLGW